MTKNKIEICTACEYPYGEHPSYFDLKDMKMFCFICGRQIERKVNVSDTYDAELFMWHAEERYRVRGNICERCNGECDRQAKLFNKLNK